VDTTSNNGVTITWSNPNNIADVAYMLIPANQTVSDQGTINLQNVKCASNNGLSPITFINSGNSQTSISITINSMQNCNIYPISNSTITTYNMQAINVYLDNSVGFSRTIELYYQNTLSLEQMYLVGQNTGTTDQTQIFESSITSAQLTNQLSMSFVNSIGQTYLVNSVQNLNINLNSSSQYSLTLVGNSMSLVSVNASNNQVLTQNLPCLTQMSGTNNLNVSFNFSGIASNYYKFTIVVQLTILGRVLQEDSNSNISSKSTVAEFDSQNTYYIGTSLEIQDLIRKQQQNSQNALSAQSNNTTTIALAVVLSVVIFSFIFVILIWKREKIFRKFKKEAIKYNEPDAILISTVPIPQESPEIQRNNQAQQENFDIQENHGNLQENFEIQEKYENQEHFEIETEKPINAQFYDNIIENSGKFEQIILGYEEKESNVENNNNALQDHCEVEIEEKNQINVELNENSIENSGKLEQQVDLEYEEKQQSNKLNNVEIKDHQNHIEDIKKSENTDKEVVRNEMKATTERIKIMFFDELE